MATAQGDASGAGTAASFEAQIRAKSRPVLGPDEREDAAAEKAAAEARWAAARCREAAAEQVKRAEAYEAQAAKLEKKGS